MNERCWKQILEYRVKVLEKEAVWRKQAENALRESEAWFRSLFENAPVWIQVLDTHGTILLTNPISIRETGYSEKELVGSNIAKFFTPATQQSFAGQILTLCEQGIVRQKVEVVRKDGVILYMHCTISAVYDEQKNIKFFLAFQRDISEHNDSERKSADFE